MRRRARDGLLAGMLTALLAASLAALAAGSDPASGPDLGDAALRAAYRRPAALPEAPPDNPMNAAKAELGRRLFFDPSLSASGTTSCASCHQPALGFSDGRARALGNEGQDLRRRTPTIWNLAWAPFLFWDGRAEGLEAQAAAPIEAHEEMGQPLGALADRLAADPTWRDAFARAFPQESSGEARPVTRETLTRALAAWERTLVSPRTRFDAWVEGDDAALTPAERRGLALFHGPAGCAECHAGWAFTDHAFYDIGLPEGRPPDLGRGPVLGEARADRAFKTPTLREAMRRGPFMHDGSLPTIESVLDHYAGGVVARPTLAPELPRGLTLSPGQRADLTAFLATLTSAPDAPLPEMATPPPAAPVPLAPVSLARVSQRGRQFAPGRVALTSGGTLEIANDDSTAHNIRIDAPGLRLNSGIQDPGRTVTWRLDRPGRYVAFCGIHPRMRLEVTVAVP